MTEQKTGLDFEAFRRAEEEHDLDSMLGLYADDAGWRIVDRNSPPSAPFELRGKEEIAGYLKDVFSREMTHRIENEVIGKERMAFNEVCEYPNGKCVYSATTLDAPDGRISRQVSVVVWDE
jgi:hypothetical protein